MKGLRSFFALEAASGLLLVAMAILAMSLANSPWREAYEAVWVTHLSLGIGRFQLAGPLSFWVDDGLMALFFLLVSMEIKRELLQGKLARADQAILPGIAALGGVLMPALIYVGFNRGGAALHGWAIPSATDIAFSLGVLSLLGPRVPPSLKIFLTTLAVMDDLAAILIIALVYNTHFSWWGGGAALGITAVLLLLNRLGVRWLTPYLLLGFLLWLAVLDSGLHATMAGVILGFCLPLRQADGERRPPPLVRLERRLHPYVAFGVMPLFALCNAGLALDGLRWESLLHPVPLGIALGLLLGKPLGIFGATWIAIRSKRAQMPAGADWGSLWAMGMLGGIGFTMSLFITPLAFADAALQSEARLGILAGSFASALAGYALFRLLRR